ncbi:MAG: hypothetical protein B7Z80_25580 [Rhodospirillales bacterium 20-64-7]|nr:MAG: hypothetical protein B7Z80_25580 [Rhodospirillales bacterium 20-64-7]
MFVTRRQKLIAPLLRSVNLLRARPDGEHEMSFNRLFFAVVIVAVLLPGWNIRQSNSALLGMAIYIPLALGVLGHILLRPGVYWSRRLFALLLDCGFLSWQLHLGGGAAALFFPIYLWIIFGNGFRFGISSLVMAVPVAAISFGMVIATTPYWYHQLRLSEGLLIGLIILPAYAGTLIRKISQATLAAQEANKAKSLFLASVSHELRTPLTAIVGMAGLLKTERLEREQQEMVETIDVAARSLRSLINSLLDLSRIEAGRMPNTVETFELLTLLSDVRRMFQSQLQTKGLGFDIRIAPAAPSHLRTSRQHLQDILLNLVGNAIKFTEIGGVSVAVDARPGSAEHAVTLEIAVTDTGIGIAPQDQARIFENFTQANETILNRFGGTGLGLAIAQQLASLLGGTIAVESEPGKGSTFRLTIQAEAVAGETAVPQALAPQPAPRGPTPMPTPMPVPAPLPVPGPALAPAQKCRALLVDDNRVNQRVFSRILESAGHEVLLAENGEQALDLLERETNRLDIVLMDFNMPELDGLEATKLFRAMSLGDDRLPIIGLTADAAALSDGRWQEAGMDGCLIKPVDPAAFLAAVETMARAAPAASGKAVMALNEHPRFRPAAVPALDETVFGNLRQLGDATFIDELLSDFLSDTAGLIETLVQAARLGDSQAFRNYAHALRSSAANVGATALGELCAPFIGMRASELQTRAADLANRAQGELWRTREAIASLRSSRRANNA